MKRTRTDEQITAQQLAQLAATLMANNPKLSIREAIILAWALFIACCKRLRDEEK